MTDTITLPREMDEDLWYLVGGALGAESPEQCARAAPFWKRLVTRADNDKAFKAKYKKPVSLWVYRGDTNYYTPVQVDINVGSKTIKRWLMVAVDTYGEPVNDCPSIQVTWQFDCSLEVMIQGLVMNGVSQVPVTKKD